MTIAGGFVGGLSAARYGVIRTLLLGGLLAAATNLLFMVLAGDDMAWLIFTISADSLSAGIAGVAFVAFLSSLTNVSFTATQYVIFSSLMTLVPETVASYSESIVGVVGYSFFFLLTAIMGIPVLLLIVWVTKRLDNC